MAKNVKRASTTVKWMSRNHHFGNFTEVEDPIEENNGVQKDNQAIENVNFNEYFVVHDILH